jgi:AraC-like DNA-binding protein
VRVINEHVTHPDQSLRFLRFEVDAFRAERHRHRQLELTWVERGVGLRYVGDSVTPFGAGDLVLLGVDLPHAWLSADARPDFTSIASVIQFPLALLEQATFPELLAARPLAEQARRGLAIRGPAAEAVTAVLTAMATADRYGQLAGLVHILGALSRHAADLAPIAASPLHPGVELESTRSIDRVTEWVARNLHGNLRVVEAARLAGISPAAFSRYFRRESGKPFSTYVNDVRCGEACVKLRQSRKPIAVVAAECGFASISHFNRQFRRRLGLTPQQYRRRGWPPRGWPPRGWPPRG